MIGVISIPTSPVCIGRALESGELSPAPAPPFRTSGVESVAVDALWESLGLSISIAFWDAPLEQYLAPARASLGDESERARVEGRALAFEDAVELALRDGAEVERERRDSNPRSPA